MIAALAGLLAIGSAEPAGAQAGPSTDQPTAGQPTSTAFPGNVVVFSGHGWGHGRGLGQWGSFGYAVDYGSGYADILSHFYGNTAMAGIGDPTMTVRLVGLDSVDLIVSSNSAFNIGGVPISAGAAGRLSRRGDGLFDLWTRVNCTAGDLWYAGTVDPTATSSVGDPGNDINQMLMTCLPGGETRNYRGQLAEVFGGGDVHTINIVSTEQYLRGVVPRESPASWADSGGGKGMQALMAQAVAARSYALAEGGEGGGRYSYAKTCDTTSCQVYGGAGLNGTRIEDNRSDFAVGATGGQVRRFSSNGVLARTEFSSSTGGFTDPVSFPLADDAGDTRSPFHDWSTNVSTSTIESAYGVGSLQGIAVLNRNGYGDGGGRALQVQISGSSKTVTVSGADVQSRLGLRSTWFFAASQPPPLLFFERNANSAGPVDNQLAFGQAGDIPVACEFVNRTATVAVFRAGTWFVRLSNNTGPADNSFQFGDKGDFPVCGDWNGDGVATPGVYRNGVFYLRNQNSTGPADITFAYGSPGDQPVVGDWDLDNKDTVGVFRKGTFFLRNSNSLGPPDGAFNFGNNGDFAVVGHWSGAPYASLGVWRSGTFFEKDSNLSGGADRSVAFGNGTDFPIVGDWDGNGTDTVGVVRVGT